MCFMVSQAGEGLRLQPQTLKIIEKNILHGFQKWGGLRFSQDQTPRFGLTYSDCQSRTPRPEPIVQALFPE